MVLGYGWGVGWVQGAGGNEVGGVCVPLPPPGWETGVLVAEKLGVGKSVGTLVAVGGEVGVIVGVGVRVGVRVGNGGVSVGAVVGLPGVRPATSGRKSGSLVKVGNNARASVALTSFSGLMAVGTRVGIAGCKIVPQARSRKHRNEKRVVFATNCFLFIIECVSYMP